MHVTRTSDGGDYTPFKAPVTCNCYFELHATGGATCQPCRTNSDCPAGAPSCNKFGPQPQQGYCDL
jgi:Cys-rich repeat protein